MNAYNNTTTIQESRNSYNELLNRALKRINDRKRSKTAQEPEEVTTTATDVTTTPTQQPREAFEKVGDVMGIGVYKYTRNANQSEEVTTEPTEESKPEQVTATAPSKTNKTRRTKTASPKPLGRDIYHIFPEKLSKWALLFDKSVYHDPEGYALLSDNVVLIESKLDYKEEYSGKLIQEDGTESKKDMQLFSKYKDICRPAGDKYAVTPKEIEERIKGEEFARKKRVICSILESDDVTDEEVKIHLKDNKDVRDYVNEQTKTQFVKLLLPAGESVYLYVRHIKRALKVAKTLSTNCISTANRIFQFTGEAGRIIVAGCITRPEDENSMNPLIIDLTDATPAPADTTAIEEATPATAPQATEEDTTTVPEATAETPVQEPEEVTTEEVTELAVEQENDNAPVLLDLIKRYGNTGADYLDTLGYNQATEQVYSTKRGNSTKVTERYYTIDGRTIYGLYRRYNKNGKRAEFAVYQDGQRIETRTYGKNNNNYKAEIQYNGGEFVYNVTDGKITGGYYTTADKLTIVRFDDDNRPTTLRDLPAPAPSKPTSKETTKEEPATTKQEQPTSKTATAPTPETTTTPEEVKEVTTSNQENGPVPYWLLLDQELRAQQEEQEQETALATPEKSEEEPAPATEATDDPEEVVFLKGAELEKAIDEYIKKHEDLCDMLDIKYYKSRYYYYITPDGYIVKLKKNKPRRNLYIADEGPFYESYAKGEVTDRSIFFSHNLETLSDFDRDRLDSTACCRVKRTEDGTLSISTYDMRPEYEYDEETGTYKEIPAKKPTPRELAVYVAAWNAYEADQRARLEKYWKRYSDKVCVNTYWADR